MLNKNDPHFLDDMTVNYLSPFHGIRELRPSLRYDGEDLKLVITINLGAVVTERDFIEKLPEAVSKVQKSLYPALSDRARRFEMLREALKDVLRV
jgi:hypothetical protein